MKRIILLLFLISGVLSAQDLSQKWLFSGLTDYADLNTLISPSGKYIYVYDYYNHKLVNLETQKVEYVYYNKEGLNTPVAFLNSDYEILLRGADVLGTLNFQTGQLKKFDVQHNFGDIVLCSLSPNADTVAFAYYYCWDGYGYNKYVNYSYGVFIKDLKNNKEEFFEDSTYTIPAYSSYTHYGYADFVALAPSGDRIAVYNIYEYDSTYVNIYELKDLKKGALQCRIRVDSLRGTTGLAFTPDSKHVLTTHDNGKMIQWNASSGQCESIDRPHDTTISFQDIRIRDSIVRILYKDRNIWWSEDDVYKHDTILRYNFISRKVVDSVAIGQSRYYTVDTNLRYSTGISKKGDIVLHDLAANTSVNISEKYYISPVNAFYCHNNKIFSHSSDSNLVNLRSLYYVRVLDGISYPDNSKIIHSHNGKYYIIISDSSLRVFDCAKKEIIWAYQRPNCFYEKVACFSQDDASIWVVMDTLKINQFSTTDGMLMNTVRFKDTKDSLVREISFIEPRSDNQELLAELWISNTNTEKYYSYSACIGLDGTYTRNEWNYFFSHLGFVAMSYIDDNHLLYRIESPFDHSNHWYCIGRESMDTLFEYRTSQNFKRSEKLSTCTESKELKGFFLSNRAGDIAFYRYDSPDPIWQTSLGWPIVGVVLRTDTKELLVASVDGSIRCYNARDLIKFLPTEEEMELDTEGSCFCPNPVGDFIRFRPGVQSGTVRIVNTLGIEVLAMPYAETLYVGELPQGVYFLQINGRAFKFVKK